MRNAIVDLIGREIGSGDRLFIEESQAVLIGKGAFLQWFVEDSITSAQHRLAVDTVRKADARSEILEGNILWTLVPITSGSAAEISVGAPNARRARIRQRGIHV